MFSGRIAIVPVGPFHKVKLDCGFPLVAYVTTHSLEELPFGRVRQVTVSFKATAVHVIRQVKKCVIFIVRQEDSTRQSRLLTQKGNGP